MAMLRVTAVEFSLLLGLGPSLYLVSLLYILKFIDCVLLLDIPPDYLNGVCDAVLRLFGIAPIVFAGSIGSFLIIIRIM